jgi:hypothetical protein
VLVVSRFGGEPVLAEGGGFTGGGEQAGGRERRVGERGEHGGGYQPLRVRSEYVKLGVPVLEPVSLASSVMSASVVSVPTA